MGERNADSRGKKIVFVSNCLLNANNKVQEFARYPGMFFEILTTLNRYGIGVEQMPCPETLYAGNQRWWHSRNLYDNAGFRRFCRELAERTVDYIENYGIVGYQVVGILVCDGSPTCGYSISSYYENGGGHPAEPVRSFKERPGIYTEELLKAVEARGVKLPPILYRARAGSPPCRSERTSPCFWLIVSIDLFRKTEKGCIYYGNDICTESSGKSRRQRLC